MVGGRPHNYLRRSSNGQRSSSDISILILAWYAGTFTGFYIPTGYETHGGRRLCDDQCMYADGFIAKSVKVIVQTMETSYPASKIIGEKGNLVITEMHVILMESGLKNDADYKNSF